MSNRTHMKGVCCIVAALCCWLPKAHGTSTNATGVRYWRGTGNNENYHSIVVALDGQRGTLFGEVNGVTTNYFPFWYPNSDRWYHYDLANGSSATSTNGRIAYNNPIAGFGSRVGGSPLYCGQTYRWGLYAGHNDYTTDLDVWIDVYLKVNGECATNCTNSYLGFYVPNQTEVTAWKEFTTNDFSITKTGFGLRATLHRLSGPAWGVDEPGFEDNAFLLSVEADSSATNYIYDVYVYGKATDYTWLVLNSTNYAKASDLFTMEFESQPPLRSTFIDHPHFAGIPLPPEYAGKSLEELLAYSAAITNQIWLTNNSAYTTLDNSPELRRHPILDQFVSDMRNDPLALTAYVLNEIELRDPLGYAKSGEVATDSVNHGGITRNALGTLLERQGSPAEICALLVYFLRQAGYHAGYVFPTNSNIKLLDARLSKLLRIQLRGAVDEEDGTLYTTNRLITVNYPWVVANIAGKCVHIFPWLKDTEVKEGLELWQYMPTNLNTGYKWVREYVFGNSAILNLGAGETDVPRVLFPRWVIQQLRLGHPGISIDDLGVKCLNRRKDFHSWDEMPTPTFFSNQSQIVVVENLVAVTNAFPSRTLQFDSVQVEILRSSTCIIDTGERRMCDIQNRKFLIYTNEGKLRLWLEEFRQGFGTNETNFTQGILTNRQVLETNLLAGDSSFDVRITFIQQRWLTNQSRVSFMDFKPRLTNTQTYTIQKSDLAAICLNYGRVTREMLDVQAQKIWREEKLKSRDSQYVPEARVGFEGTAAYLMGMSYLERCTRFQQQFQDLHKVRRLSALDCGLAKFREVEQDGKKMQPAVDFVRLAEVDAANGSLRPDRHEDNGQTYEDYFWLDAAAASAEEHAVINDAFAENYAISTVKLLQLAQERSGPNKAGIVELDVNNYTTRGGQTNAGYGSTFLRDFDQGIWSQVTNAFKSGHRNPGGRYTRVFVTPGSILSDSGKYKGMGALIVSPGDFWSLISDNQNGGYGSIFDDPTPKKDRYHLSFTLEFTSDGYVSYVSLNDLAHLVLRDNSPTTVDRFYTPDFEVIPTPDQTARSQTWTEPLGLPSNVPHDEFTKTFEEFKPLGVPEFWPNDNGLVADPVNPVTGAFYVDAVDLRLPGPMPLEVRRNYSSHNRARNELGHGWKLNYMPQLVPRTNAAGRILIDAAEVDGSVIAYRKTNSIWAPFPEDNPGMSTHTTRGTGSKANFFNARIEKLTNDSVVHFYLYSPDGSVRDFKMDSFPITAGTSNGTSRLERTRPYLQSWRDHRGNSYKFIYEGDSNKVEYGQVRRIESSNGSALGFRYDTYARIVEAFTSDGRRIYYEYDQYGDLVGVTLPDGNEIQYAYDHYSFTNQAKTELDSYHLLAREFKPDGRTLRNDYDDKRRVTNQLSTVGADLNLVRNATFAYSNNFILNKAHTNMVSGYTLITDVNNNVTRYDYTNGLITRIVDPLNQTNIQEWYVTGTEETGAYRRSLKSETGKRGLKTSFNYDANGNVTNTIVTGDLTGDGTLTQTATNTFAYNTNNLLTESVDPSGRKTEIRYHSQFLFLPEQVIASANGVMIATNFSEYYSVTNVLTNGTLKITNTAVGVLRRQIRAYSSSDASTNEWERDGRGFVTRQIQYTGTGDPNITNTFFYNGRSELVEKQDPLGRKTRYDYDGMGRPKWTEVLDETGKQLSGAYTYYNANGEPEWVDGPRYDPEDYVYNDYDGAGRQTIQIRWRSQAKADGSGVEAVPGYDQFATTYQEWDGFGNLIKVTDPRGTFVTNAYDAIGQKVLTRVLDANGAVLKSEMFKYEMGGQVAAHTNALGGVTEFLYTSTGRPRFQKNPDGSTNQWRYYLDGRGQREIQVNNAYWETTYDDANRKVTRKFFSAAGTALATNVTEFDRRGNVIRTVDPAGFAGTNKYDGLDRVKWSAGPVVASTRPPGAPEFPPLPPSIQQAATNYYDASGAVTISINSAGHTNIIFSDALGRVTRSVTYRNTVIERETTTAYAANHHGATVTNSPGANATAATTWTDNSGSPVLSVGYPASGVRHFTRSVYDSVGNLTFQTRASITNSTLIEWSGVSTAYDALSRPSSKSERDGAITTFQYDAAGNLTNRVSPGSLANRATFNSKGQKLEDYIFGGSLGSRTNTYAYSPIGLLAFRTNNLGIVCQYIYDDWLRPVTNIHDGPLSNQDIITSFSYDARGLLTTVSERFTDASVGPSNTVQRAHTAYGQLKDESVFTGNRKVFGLAQTWDETGRRSSVAYDPAQSVLNGAKFGFNMTYRSDGLLRHFYGNTGIADYDYDNSGRLWVRTLTPRNTLGQRITSINQWDGLGRPLVINTTINSLSRLHETLSWTGDGLLSTHTVSNALFTDQRAYTYQSLTRRLTEERLNLDTSQRWTNTFTYDAGQASQAGVLTRIGQPEAAGVAWSGGADALLRVTAETNNAIRRPAFGRINGPAAVQALLDGQPMPVTVLGTQALSWHATLELSPGSHQLTAQALHPSGIYTASTNHSFTVTNTASDRVQATHDAIGQVTQKIYISNGATNRTQTFTWDGKGRLQKIVERDSAQTGFDWTAIYDGLDRRLQTTTLTVTNGASQTNQLTVINQYYDPEYAFLEVGVSVNGQTTWKVLGPSLNGTYGSLSGLGGFEAIVPGPELFCPMLSDARGNILGVYDPGHNAFMWNTNRPTGYGAVPGHRPPPLGHGAGLAEASAWRGRWADIHGGIQLAHRPYDPVAGRFLSFDPLGLGPSDNPLGFPADPINYDDPLGLFGIQPLKYDSPPNPYAELVNAMNRFDAGLHEFAGAIADANVSAHYGPLNAFYANEAAINSAFYQNAGAYQNQTYNQFVNGLAWIGQEQVRQEQINGRLTGVLRDAPRTVAQDLSFVADLTPGINLVKATFQTTLGIDLFTGKEVSRGWNAAAVGLAFAPAAGLVRPNGVGQAAILPRVAISSGQLGREGEALASQITGAAKNTQSWVINGRTRIPDQVLAQDIFTGNPTIVTEVKNVQRQSLTLQLRDNVDLVGPGGKVNVALPPSARLSRPLQRAFADPLNPLNRIDLVAP